MKKRLTALVCCLLLAIQLSTPPAVAAGNVYFMAAGETVLPVTDSTMPFWSDGHLYIASSIFTGIVRESVGVSQNWNSAKNLLIVYGSQGMSLRFEIGKNYALDRNDNPIYPGAIQKGSTVFVPVGIIAKTFGLEYSVVDVEHGHMIWLRQPNHVLSKELFANAASFQMATRYEEYLKTREENQYAQGGLDVEEGKEIEGKSIYLCLEAGKNAEELLDTLDRYQAGAAFFCSVEFLETQGDLLRRMAVTGHTIGILVDGADEKAAEEQLTAGNAALARATCGKTRLVMLKNIGKERMEAVQELGYTCLEPDLDRSGYELSSAAGATNLLRRVSARRGDVTVWLADTANSRGLRNVLHTTESVDGFCLALTETA